MMQPVQDWSNHTVRLWLSKVNCGCLRDTFERHRLTGRDLLELTETQLKEDLEVDQLHLRVLLVRELRSLRAKVRLLVRVDYGAEACSIRVPDLLSYTMTDLLKDATGFYHLESPHCYLTDAQGVVWGSSSVLSMFDSRLLQREVIRLERQDQPQLEADGSIDFDESNPFHICQIKVLSEENTCPVKSLKFTDLDFAFSPPVNLSSTLPTYPKSSSSLANVVRQSSIKANALAKSRRDKLHSQIKTSSTTPPESVHESGPYEGCSVLDNHADQEACGGTSLVLKRSY
jgi:hypothetical protein